MCVRDPLRACMRHYCDYSFVLLLKSVASIAYSAAAAAAAMALHTTGAVFSGRRTSYDYNGDCKMRLNGSL